MNQILALYFVLIWQASLIAQGKILLVQKVTITDRTVGSFCSKLHFTYLVHLDEHSKLQVLVNVVGALGEMATNKSNIALIRQANGIPHLIALLTGTNEDLLINTTRALGRIAEDRDSVPYVQVSS